MTDPFTEAHRETLTRALMDYWVRHKSTKPGEVGTPENVFYSVKSAVDVLLPVYAAAFAASQPRKQEPPRLCKCPAYVNVAGPYPSGFCKDCGDYYPAKPRDVKAL